MSNAAKSSCAVSLDPRSRHACGWTVDEAQTSELDSSPSVSASFSIETPSFSYFFGKHQPGWETFKTSAVMPTTMPSSVRKRYWLRRIGSLTQPRV